MGIRDVLFGRKQLKEASREQLFALSTARITLELLGLKPGGAAAVVFKPLSAGEFAQAEADLRELLAAVAHDSGSRLERKGDDYGYQWLILHDEDFEDLVTGIHLVGGELADRGFSSQLLAAVFRFEDGAQPAYFVYGYKRGTFWPFVPTGKNERDNAKELSLKAKIENELPIEPDLTRWFGLFGAPL